MPWFLALLLTTPVFAQNQCERLEASLMDLENRLLATQLQGCRDLRPSDFGFADNFGVDPTKPTSELGSSPGEMKMRYFRQLVCQNVGGVDLALAETEATLALSDGLEDLRAQVVASQNALAQDASWNQPEHQSALQLSRDVTLGAAAEALIQSPHLPALFSESTTSGQWEARLTSFCASGPQSTTPFCDIFRTYSRSASNTRPALMMSELSAFLDQLRGALDETSKTLSEQQKTDMLAALRLQNGTQSTSFIDYQEGFAQAGFFELTGSQRLSQSQIQFIRQGQLSTPGNTQLPALISLVNRINTSRARLQVSSALSQFRQNSDDAHQRLLARVRARWSSLYSRLNPAASSSAIPCTNIVADNGELIPGKARELFQCIRTEWSRRPSSNEADNAMYYQMEALLMSGPAASEGKSTLQLRHEEVRRCTQPSTVQAWLQGSAPASSQCNLERIGNRPFTEELRQITLGVRNRLQAQEDRRLRFRRFAFDQAARCTDAGYSVLQTPELVLCRPSAEPHTLAPILELSRNAMRFAHEGMESSVVFDKERDCPPGQQDEFAVLCEIAHGRGTSADSGAIEIYNGTPATAPVDAPSRRSDPLVSDMLTGVANDLANQYLASRFRNNQPQTYSWPGNMYRPMPYSQPLSLSMSDYVMSNASFYGGFGRYYTCSTCGFGSGPAAFNQRWGLSGSTPVAGLGGSGLMGGSLSSRFFGGGGSMAGGFFNF